MRFSLCLLLIVAVVIAQPTPKPSPKPAPAANPQYFTFRDVIDASRAFLEEEFVAVDDINKLQRFDQAIPHQNYTVHEILDNTTYYIWTSIKGRIPKQCCSSTKPYFEEDSVPPTATWVGTSKISIYNPSNNHTGSYMVDQWTYNDTMNGCDWIYYFMAATKVPVLFQYTGDGCPRPAEEQISEIFYNYQIGQPPNYYFSLPPQCTQPTISCNNECCQVADDATLSCGAC